MEENNFNDSTAVNSETEQEEFELSHTDKLVGVFTEPANTFEKISHFPPKHTDWFLPVIFFIVVLILANYLMMSNPVIKHALQEKQIANIEKNFQEMVDKGQMSQEQADQQMERIRDRMTSQNMGITMIFSVFGILIITFIVFFIVSGVYFLFGRLIYKDEGTYGSAMVANGLPFYILIIQTILSVILALTMNRFIQGTSVAAIIDADTSTFTGWVLGKLDIISIWFYIVVAMALAKMFKSKNNVKYYAAVFGVWLGFSLLFFLLAKVIPFLKWFGV